MKEEEIRKRRAFNSYLKIVAKDAGEFFDFSSFTAIHCPACNSSSNIFEFEKLGFRYVSCKNCSTLFVSPRPNFETIKRFYSKSRSADFFVNQFFKPVAEARREKIFKPRVEYLSKVLRGNKRLVIGDIGAGFGLFLEEFKKRMPGNRYICIEPSLEMAEVCRKKKLEVKSMCLEDMDSYE